MCERERDSRKVRERERERMEGREGERDLVGPNVTVLIPVTHIPKVVQFL